MNQILNVAFNSLMGPVESSDIGSSFLLMLQGMLGIFIVMVLIYIVILVLGKVGKSKPKDDKSKKDE